MTYPETIQFLYKLRWYGTKLGLTNVQRLADLAGTPHQELRFIHVAGTNGKGSTCAMLESVYRQAGLRVGLFTSPHLVSFGERIQVNRRPIPEADIVRLVDQCRPWLDQFTQEEHPTFFEVVTVIALRYFREQQCDLVIWETGLGGRLDATNIVTPLASVITNIQFDHQKWLGETLASIAAEKAGIIKPARPVITGTDAPEAFAVIEATARRQNAPLTFVPPAAADSPEVKDLRLPLLGHHQRVNAAVTLAVIQSLQPVIKVKEGDISDGFARVHWPGRLQLVTRADGRRVLLDGAHNIGATHILAEAFQEYFPGQKPALVLGILQDKDWPAMCRILAPLAERILLVPVHNERTAQPHGLAEACSQANPAAGIRECSSLTEALALTRDDAFVAITGSLYLVGEAMELLHLSAAPDPRERSLNDWGAAAR